MWIQTQSRQQIINSDRVINIFIDKTGTKIMANTTREDAFSFVLGEYKDRETCLKVLEHITIGMDNNLPGIPMPLGGEVDDWANGIENVAAINIAHKFVK